MSITQHLALIERLCSAEFPAEPGRSDSGTGGPGHHVAARDFTRPMHEDDRGAWGVAGGSNNDPSCELCASARQRHERVREGNSQERGEKNTDHASI